MELKRYKEEADIFKKVAQALLDLENKHDKLTEEYMKKAEDLKTKVQLFVASKKKPRGRPKRTIPLETVNEDEKKEEQDKKKRKTRNNATKTTEVTKVISKSKRTRGGKRKSSDSPSHEEPQPKSARKEEIISTVTLEKNKSIKECSVILTRLDIPEVQVLCKTDVHAQSHSSKNDNGTFRVESTPSNKKVFGPDKKVNSPISEAELKGNNRSPTQMEENKVVGKSETPKTPIIEVNGATSEREESPLKERRFSARRKSNSKTQDQIEGSPSFKKPLPVGETVPSEYVEQEDESAHHNTTNKPSTEQSNIADDTEDITVASKKRKKRSKRRKGKSSKTTKEDSDSVLPVNEVKENASPETNAAEKLPIELPSSPAHAEIKSIVSQRVTRSKRRKEPYNVPTRDGDIVSASSASDNEKQANDPPESTVKDPTKETSSTMQVDDKPVTTQRVTRSKRRKETSNAPVKNGGTTNTASSGSEEENPKPKKGSAIMKAQLLKQAADMFTPVGSHVEKENHFNRQMKTGEKIVMKGATPLKNHNSFITTSKIRTPVYSSAKLKIATIEEAERRRKEEEALRKKMKEEEAVRNRIERLKAKQEDIRRRNEEKMQKVAAFREAANKETEERLAKKEEEKRKEEELRLKNLKDMEKLKKQRLEEQRLKEAQEKKAKEMMKAKANIIPLKDKDNYDIADISPDDDDCNDDDNNHVKKEIPLWAKKGEDRLRHERMQSYVPMDVVADFFACPGQTPDLTQFFGKMTMKRVRTSSAVWLDTPPLKKF